MSEEIQKILSALQLLRPKVAQFVFFDTIIPKSTIAVREAVIAFKTKNPDIEEIDFIINSPGGLADDAYRIIRTLRTNFKTVNVIVPFWAKSAATLITLGANNIIMDEFGEFGALDAQLGKPREDSPEYERESALNDEHSVSIIENRYKLMYEQMYIRLYEHKKINMSKHEVSKQLLENLSKFFKPLLNQINPYKLGEKKRILDIGGQYALRILHQFGSPKDHQSARSLVNYLLNECPDHGYVVDRAIIENFLTNVSSSNKFGEDYKLKLQELSLHLMSSDDEIEFAGFIDIIEPLQYPNTNESVSQELGSSNVTQSGQIVNTDEQKTENPNNEQPNPEVTINIEERPLN